MGIISITSPQNPPALAQVDQLRGVLLSAGSVGRSRRVQVMQPAKHFNQVAACLIEVFNGEGKLFDPIVSHGAHSWWL